MTNKDLAEIMFPNLEHDMAYYENLYPERNLKEGEVVTRFAPSPTGFVHMGSLLTTLIANKVPHDNGGVFYLRIEDTDQKRSVENGINGIINDLKQFDISIDEGVISEDKQIGKYGPYIQSQRREIYNAYAKYLVENDYAYPCFCSAEDLESMRERQEHKKERIGYYGRYAKCRRLSIEEMIEKIKNGEEYVVRLKSPGNFDKKIVFNDLVRGKIEFPENDIDTVLIKSDGLPVYHFAHVVDDHLMHTTHVLRGEEWISSTPIHLQLFNIFGFKLPKFAHLGLVMKVDEEGVRRKLSKRKDPEAAVSYYHQKGIPVMAVKLYLMTIANSNFEAWMDANKDKTIDDFKFDFKKMSVSGSLFDIDKLLNLSKNYLSRLKNTEIYDNALIWSKEFDQEFYDLLVEYKDTALNIFNIERNQKKPRKDFASYSELKNYVWFLFEELYSKKTDKFKDIEVKPFFNKEILSDYINNYYSDTDDKELWYNKLKDLADYYGFAKEVKEYKENPDNYKGHIGDVCELIRVAITSKTMTPDLYEIMKILGKEKLTKRINEFNSYLDTL